MPRKSKPPSTLEVFHVLPPSMVRTMAPSVPLAQTTRSSTALTPRKDAVVTISVRMLNSQFPWQHRGMTHVSRRSFMTTSIAASTAALSYGRTLKTIGVQLYTVRSIIDQKPLETLKALDQIGYREAEVIQGNMNKIWPDLKQTALKPVSLHMDTVLFTRNQDKLPPALDEAKEKGFEYVVCPYIAPQDRGGGDVMNKLGETLNSAGERCQKAGLHLCYHNHAFEFQPEGSGTLLDVLMQTTDPALVNLEMDIMWVTVAGADPVS